MSEALKRQPDTETISQYDLSRKTDKTRWLIAAAAALALHGTIAVGTQATPGNIEKVRQTISFLIQEAGHKISSAINAFKQNSEEQEAKTEQVITWRNALGKNPNLPDFDYGDFFLKLSWLEGHISKEEFEKDQQKLAKSIKYYQDLAKKTSEGFFSTIKKMMEEHFGEYMEWSAQLHTLLNDGKGNCNARAQMMISLIKGVYGNKIPMKVRISRQKLADGREQLHSDLLIQIYSKWHIVKPGIPETEITDLEGTVIFDVSDYVKTYLKEDKEKHESNTVRPEKTPNKNKLDATGTDALVNLEGNIDPKKLKTHGETHSREPIEMTVMPGDLQAPTKDKPDTDTDTNHPKRQLTNREVIDAALSKAIKISPDIESLEPLRGIPLDIILITNTDSKDEKPPYEYELVSTAQWPSFQPLAETPPKEVLIAISGRDKNNDGTIGPELPTPDLSPLYGETTVSKIVAYNIENLDGLIQILQNFVIQEVAIRIISYQENNQTPLKPLKDARITKSLDIRIIARGGTMDLTGIDSLAITPPELRMSLHAAEQKFLNLEALGRVHFTTFETSDDALDLGVLDGVVIQADTVKFVTAPSKHFHGKYLKDIFRTRRVEIIDKETEYSNTALEPVRGMPPLDFLSVEMDQHKDKGIKTKPLPPGKKYGHMSFHEIQTGKKPKLDLSPLQETPITEISICRGYELVSRGSLGMARVTTIMDGQAYTGEEGKDAVLPYLQD